MLNSQKRDRSARANLESCLVKFCIVYHALYLQYMFLNFKFLFKLAPHFKVGKLIG